MATPTSAKPESHPFLKLYPRLSRFYGMSWQDISDMPNFAIVAYAEAIPAIEASEMLDAILVATLPHASEEDQTRIHDELVETANDGETPRGPSADLHALSLIGVKVVKCDA